MWYILDKDNKPIPSDVNEYNKWQSKNQETKCVKQEYIGDLYVSTVFLGLDHSFRSNIPLLWETMVFNGEDDIYQERYSCYEDAVEGHKRALELANSKL
jgi:hypothetical protein